MKHFHHKKTFVRKEQRFNPHRYWVIFVLCFLGAIVLEVGYFTWYFNTTSKKLDAVVTPNLETNAPQIQMMEKSLDATEAAVRSRIGEISTQ